MNVLLFRTPAKIETDPYCKVAKECGMQPFCLPVLEFTMINEDELNAALSRPDLYCGLIVTSQRAVEALQRSHQQHTAVWHQWCSNPCFVVGKATSSAASAIGLQCVGESSGSAQSLLPHIVEHAVKHKDKSVLFLCGNLKKETIPVSLSDQNVPFTSITVYETRCCSGLQASLANYLQTIDVLDNKSNTPCSKLTLCPNVVVYFSSSGVQFTKDMWSSLNVDVNLFKWIAIGETTSSELQQTGFKVAAMADMPNPEGLRNALTSLNLS